MSDALSNRELLRRYEPILRFTQGERFFPMSVEPYVRACTLWVQRPNEVPQQVMPADQLDLDTLAHPYPAEFGTIHYLRLVEPYAAAKSMLSNLRRSETGDIFHAGMGRLARVGYGSRLIDALFSIALLARGRVPGDIAAAAELIYDQIRQEDNRYLYYGRVVREQGWVVLQYWFFYLFNNWRSNFFGANDHEADWEMCCIYLSENNDTGELKPEWVAYAAHDYQGDILRRRWDDPEVHKVGEHPVIYPGAGSHAGYFQPGEYLTEIELPFLAPLGRFTDRLLRFWRHQLRQYTEQSNSDSTENIAHIFRIPFVDYARGDGFSIGPGQDAAWSEPCLIEPPPPWISQYRGLWGLFTHDPFAGEDAPAGPMYNRDGSVRRSWYDPLGWAGLDKVPPSDSLLHQLQIEQSSVRAHQQHLWQEIHTKSNELQGLGVQATAMRSQPHLYQLYTEVQEQIARLTQEVDELRRQVANGQLLLDALDYYAQQAENGNPGPMRAHLRRAHRPASAARLRFSRLAELWAALSIGLMMVVMVGLFVFGREHLFWGSAAAIAMFTLIEAGFRGQLTRLIASLTVALSIVGSLVIVYEYFWQLVILAVLTTGAFILWENLREVWS